MARRERTRFPHYSNVWKKRKTNVAILKLQLDQPVEAALKFAKGKFYESKFPGQEGQLMYSLTSGECVFLPESCDEMFAAASISAHEPFVMCLRKTRAGAKFVEVQKLSDASEPALDPRRYPDAAGAFEAPTKLESQLAASITHEQQRKTSSSKVTPPVAAVATATQTRKPQPTNPIVQIPPPSQPGQTRASNVMASALIAAIDATCLATQYAASKGLMVTFAAEDVRAIAATIFIQAAKDPLFAERGAGAGGAQSWRQ